MAEHSLIENDELGTHLYESFLNDKDQEYLLLGPADCLDEMRHITSGTINLILTDLPYGVSQNKWDSIIPLEPLWKEYKRILKNNGIVVLTATQPFTAMLVMSNRDMFKYDLVWEKTIGSGQLNIKHMPLRVHEDILVFYNQRSTYNEQKTVGKPYSIKRKVNFLGEGYGKQKESEKENSGFRHARSVIKISNRRIKGGHSTQKPQELIELLIKTYSNKGDIILDSCMGSGVTGVAARKLNRRFIGIERDTKWFNKASEWIYNYE